MKKAFTLAEVLITLGVIGVIAAITIPTLIKQHQKSVVETKLKNFYTIMNNAIRLSEVDNGEITNWLPEQKNNTYNENLEFLEKYILPYLKYTKVEPCKNRIPSVCVSLTNGTMFSLKIDMNGGDMAFFINGKNEYKFKNAFLFQLNKKNDINSPKTFIEPYVFTWNGNVALLKSHTTFGCYNKSLGYGVFCAKLIQLNGWKIPDDYPW